MFHDPRLTLSPPYDAQLTALIIKHHGLIISLSVDSFGKTPVFIAGFALHGINTSVSADSLDSAFQIAYLEFGMNTNLW